MPYFDVEPLPEYPPHYGLLLAALEDSTREWRGELGQPEADAITWQPYPGGYSIGAELLHIASVEAYWIEVFSLDRQLSQEEKDRVNWQITDVDNGVWPTPPSQPIAYYFDLLDAVRRRTLESVKSFPPGDTAKEQRWGTMTLRWVLSHVVQHDSYHGGQAVMLHELWKRKASP